MAIVAKVWRLVGTAFASPGYNIVMSFGTGFASATNWHGIC